MRKRLSGFNNHYDNVISSIGSNSYDSSTNSNEISLMTDNDDDNNNIAMSSGTSRNNVHVSDGFPDNPGSVNEVDGINSILPSLDQTDEIDQTEGAGAGRTTKGKAAILVCIINLLNTVAGTGMLGLPAAYAGAGFVTGSILLIVASFFSIMGLRLLAISAKTVHGNNGIASFYSVASAAVPQFSFFIDAAVAIKGFGVATSYFITVGDCMSDSFRYILRSASSSSSSSNTDDSLGDQADSASILTSRHFWVVLALLLVLPISFFKTLSALKYTSSFSLVLILSLAVIIIMFAEGIFDPCQTNYLDYGDAYEYKQQNQNDEAQRLMEYYQNPNDDGADFDDDTCRGDTYLVNNFDSTIKNISIFIFSFACQQNVFTIVNELKNATQTRIDIVLVTAIGAALVLYLFVAVEGYRTYGSEVKGDLLLNYPQTGLVTMVSFLYPNLVH
jgi:amino acid permease